MLTAMFLQVNVMSARVSRTNKELKPKEQKSEVRTYILQVMLSPGAVAVEASVRHSQQDNSFTVGNSWRRRGRRRSRRRNIVRSNTKRRESGAEAKEDKEEGGKSLGDKGSI